MLRILQNQADTFSDRLLLRMAYELGRFAHDISVLRRLA